MTDHKTLRDLAEAATPGKWTTGKNTPSLIMMPDREGDCVIAQTFDPVPYIGIKKMHSNAAFIAASNPQAVIALLKEIESLRKAAAHCVDDQEYTGRVSLATITALKKELQNGTN